MSNTNTKTATPVPAMMFIVMLLVYVALCSYLFVRGWQALPSTTTIHTTYSILFVLLAFGYIAGVIFRKSIPLWLSDTIEVVGSTWFIALVYLLIAIVLIDLLRIANHYLHFFPAWITADYVKTKLVTLCVVLGIIAVLFSWGYYRFTHPTIVNLELTLNKRMVGDKKELRIVMVSDLHLGSVVGKDRLQKFVQLINEQKPDVILMVGDVLNADLRPVEAQHMDEDLQQLFAPLGVYAVLGNHEYLGGDVDAAVDYLKQAGIHLLRDETITVGGYFTLVGRDDRTNHNRKSLRELTDSVDKHMPLILLDHQPYHLEEAEACDVDLMLCGHTHNGQVWPVSTIVQGMYEVAQGYKQKGNTHVYVSPGLGIWGPPFRIGTRSELVVITIK